MWVESVEQVGDELVGLSVERLDDDARERTAATIAWVTLETVRGGAIDTSTPWQELMHDVMRQHVSFAVPDERAANLDAERWSEAIDCALRQFMRQNELASSVNRHIDAMLQTHRSGHPDSRSVREVS